MTAYLIADTAISDPQAYEAYKAQVQPIAEAYGGRYVVRGGAITLSEAALWTPTRIVIIEFPDRAAAEAFVGAPEYAPVKAIRNGAAASTLFIVDGV